MKTRRKQNSNNRKTQKQRGGFFKSLMFDRKYNLKYTLNDNELKCQLCNNNSFDDIKATIGAAKLMNIMAGNTTEDMINHPINILRCTSCKYCMIIYGKNLPENFKEITGSQQQTPSEQIQPQNTNTDNSQQPPPPPVKRASSFWF